MADSLLTHLQSLSWMLTPSHIYHIDRCWDSTTNGEGELSAPVTRTCERPQRQARTRHNVTSSFISARSEVGFQRFFGYASRHLWNVMSPSDVVSTEMLL